MPRSAPSLESHRLHLSESQRAAGAAKLGNMVQGERTDWSLLQIWEMSATDAAGI